MARALGAEEGPPPTRLLFYFVPNGVHMPAYTPAIEGPDWEATPVLAPLWPRRDDLLVLSGLANEAADAFDAAPHAHATGAFLTGVPVKKWEGGQAAGGVSIDQLAAQSYGWKTRFPSLELGADPTAPAGFCEEGYSCVYQTSISWAGPQTALPKTSDPAALFARLFAGEDSAATERERARRIEQRLSVLDLVGEQAASLRLDLGQADRYRLDEYLDGVREFERRLELGGEACPDLPDAPPTVVDLPTRVALMTDLMVLALRCDQTRVMSFMLQNGFSDTVYDFLGIDEGHHWLAHHDGAPDMIDKVVAINTWQYQQFGLLLDKMAAVDEGEGTLLDHSLVFMSSGMSDGNTHEYRDLPVVLAGHGGGAVSPGRHVVYPKGTPRSNLFMSLLHAVGVDVDKVGVDGVEPLAGLT